MKKLYYGYRDKWSLALGDTLPDDAIELLYVIIADTFEEAGAVHNIKQGWEPYNPVGPAEKCPKKCGSMYYPYGSGECPNCGVIA